MEKSHINNFPNFQIIISKKKPSTYQILEKIMQPTVAKPREMLLVKTRETVGEEPLQN